MRVAVDCRYIRERPSGIGTYVQALVDRMPALAPLDEFVFWAHPLAPRPLSAASNALEVTIRTAPNSPLSTLWPRWHTTFDGLDLFHNPQNILPRGVTCASVVTIQDVLAIDFPHLHRRGLDRFKGLYYPHAVRRALRKATRLIVTTAATADRVLAFEPGALPRLRVIPLAPDSCFKPPDDPDAARRRASSLIGVDAPYMLVVGENSATKRHDIAVRAFAAVLPPPWRLVLLQRLGTRGPLRRLARGLGLTDRIVWLRNLPRDDVAALVQGADALIQPSIYEGFGLPVVEAFACGCPVVASDIPALREVAGGGAMLVPPADVNRLAAALCELVGSPDLRRSLAERGLRRARDFSWDRTARETIAVYHETATR